jgi:deoxycytidine triphosphate deaminase
LVENTNNAKKIIFLNDIHDCVIDEFKKIAETNSISVKYEWINNLELEFLPDETYDLTFIDTWHVYGQLKRELEKFSKITRKYIIMHDTTVDEWEGESIRCGFNIDAQVEFSGFPREEITRGLWPAVTEFLSMHPEWVLHERYTNNNGLTVLRRNT